MNYPLAGHKIVKTIRELAARVEKVEQTTRSMCDMWHDGLKKDDICDAICDWIDKEKPVHTITTQHVPEHVGEPAYVMKPIIEGNEYYVKVTIVDPGEYREKLLIISSHR